jgi:hypothetical protein
MSLQHSSRYPNTGQLSATAGDSVVTTQLPIVAAAGLLYLLSLRFVGAPDSKQLKGELCKRLY